MMSEQVQERIAGYERWFNTLFEEYFDTVSAGLDAPSFSRFAPECLRLLRELSLRGGKRMRVVLLHVAARLVTAEPVEGLDAAALSIELLQTHGLVHDDLIDDSPTRRGDPSTYYAYRERFPGHPQTALGLTVLAGDLALTLSLQLLLDAKVAVPVRQAMVEVQTRAAADTFVGQIIDLERDFAAAPDEDILHCVSDYKSARYSILAPMQLGLLAAGEQPALFERELRDYARLLGMCGQMRDDYLDLFGDAAVMCKPTGTDIRDGKHSYTVHALLAAVDDTERRVVEAALGDPSCTPETIAALREIGERRCGGQDAGADAPVCGAGGRGGRRLAVTVARRGGHLLRTRAPVDRRASHVISGARPGVAGFRVVPPAGAGSQDVPPRHRHIHLPRQASRPPQRRHRHHRRRQHPRDPCPDDPPRESVGERASWRASTTRSPTAPMRPPTPCAPRASPWTSPPNCWTTSTPSGPGPTTRCTGWTATRSASLQRGPEDPRRHPPRAPHHPRPRRRQPYHRRGRHLPRQRQERLSPRREPPAAGRRHLRLARTGPGVLRTVPRRHHAPRPRADDRHRARHRRSPHLGPTTPPTPPMNHRPCASSGSTRLTAARPPGLWPRMRRTSPTGCGISPRPAPPLAPCFRPFCSTLPRATGDTAVGAPVDEKSVTAATKPLTDAGWKHTMDGRWIRWTSPAEEAGVQFDAFAAQKPNSTLATWIVWASPSLDHSTWTFTASPHPPARCWPTSRRTSPTKPADARPTPRRTSAARASAPRRRLSRRQRPGIRLAAPADRR
ncbi:hypothetical protein T261_0878 [Streptomyces lydicus]|nr:hypothetical protein T261_0878 [Streptomyces lydicus]